MITLLSFRYSYLLINNVFSKSVEVLVLDTALMGENRTGPTYGEATA